MFRCSLYGVIMGLAWAAMMEAKTPAGQSGKTTEERVKDTSAKVWIRKDKTLMIGGRPFYPFGWWDVPATDADFKKVKEAGFNAVLSSQFSDWREHNPNVEKINTNRVARAYLDLAEKYGLKALMMFDRSKIQTGDAGYIQTRVNALKDHPALLAWYVYDEPECLEIPPAKIELAYRTIRKADPGHPVYLVVCHPDRFKNYLSGTDILSFDPYPIVERGSNGREIFPDTVNLVAAAGTQGKPGWMILQGCDVGSAYRKVGQKVKDPRPPTVAEERNMTWQAIAAGSRGILYYAYKCWVFDVSTTPGLWEGMVGIAKEANQYQDFVLAPEEKTRIQTNVSDKDVVVSLRKKGESYALFVINLTEREIDPTTITLPLAKPVRFTLTLKPLDVKILKFKLHREQKQRSETMIKVSQPELLVKAPDDQTSVFGGAGYTRKTGMEMVLRYQYMRVSDVMDESYYKYSADNGRTWSKTILIHKQSKEENLQPMTVPSGPYFPAGPYIGGHRNPFTGETLLFGDSKRERPEAMDPNTPQFNWPQTALTYAVSRDDGRTAGPYQPLVKNGPKFTKRHPFDGLYLGQKQTYVIHEPLFLNADTVLVPIEMTVLESDGKIYNPYQWTYTQVVVLIGRRNGEGLVWDSSKPITLDAHAQSTRGVSEPTLAKLEDGRILMVIRGDNYARPDLPSRKWYAISSDNGLTWTDLAPWTFEDHSLFFSPASISTLVVHSSGRLFWFGNICPTNADGNLPRYPLVIGQVERRTGLLVRASITPIVDRTPDMHDMIEFSNFNVYEDRSTGEFVLYVCHFYPNGGPDRRGWPYTGHLYRYRIILAHRE